MLVLVGAKEARTYGLEPREELGRERMGPEEEFEGTFRRSRREAILGAG